MAAAELVKSTRIERGMTQDDLAHEAGISRQMIGHIESGRKGISYPTSRKLASVLRVSWKRLYTGPVPYRYAAELHAGATK